MDLHRLRVCILIVMTCGGCLLPRVQGDAGAGGMQDAEASAATGKPAVDPTMRAGDARSQDSAVPPSANTNIAAGAAGTIAVDAGQRATVNLGGAAVAGNFATAPADRANAAGASGSSADVAGPTAHAGALGAAGGGMSTGPLRFTSAFTMGKTIPAKYKCPMDVVGGGKGDNVSPALSWTGGPAAAKSFAIVLYDTGFNMLHWVLWDIPAGIHELPEGLAPGYELMNPAGAHQTANQGPDRHAYYGPCTGGSSASTYEYRVYALKLEKLALAESSTATQAQMAIEAGMLDKAVWTGRPQ